MEPDKYVPPVAQWKDFEYDLFHSKSVNNRFFPAKERSNRGRGRGRGGRGGRGNRGKGNKDKEKKDYYNAGGDAKQDKKNDQKPQSELPKSWKNDISGEIYFCLPFG